ncbi:UNVERIFIED_CONTAM: hypothetical protein Sradi_6679700 [Sesamum radiatum]|uniref:Uncharacterized protein n=1 Tax=Sesamum radiatum TaxID=300843 RepID=A0AAW2JRF1_SESRA
MAKLLRKIIVLLMFRLDWRKLISIFVILTVVSVLIQISTLPYSLTELIFPPPTLVSSYKSFNSAILDKQLQTNNENGSPIVLLNSSDQVNQSLASAKKKWKESQQRRRRNNLTSSNMLAPSSHPSVKNLPSRIERYLRSLTPNEALAFIKRDIDNAPLVSNDYPELYEPLFRNISTFKRYI